MRLPAALLLCLALPVGAADLPAPSPSPPIARADAQQHAQRLAALCGDCAEARALQAAIAGARQP